MQKCPVSNLLSECLNCKTVSFIKTVFNWIYIDYKFTNNLKYGEIELDI